MRTKNSAAQLNRMAASCPPEIKYAAADPVVERGTLTPAKEAVARIKINTLLEAAGRRLFPKGGAPADTCLEPTVAIKSADLNTLGENFEKAERGLVDLLLLDSRGFLRFPRGPGSQVRGQEPDRQGAGP
ncbi:MAG: hypothetical protein MZV70_50055 [Desulfobacterales bacterium]|nr:hypothetical protein [Desulfobacterales bacterium]